MSYLVLARKYRPSTFAEVVGQEHVTRTLANAFASGRVHHAFLMTGPRGCGKTTIARIIGKAVNCETGVAATGKATAPVVCGTCSSCVSIANGSAVDYQEMDGASNRGIDAIRELTEAVRYQPAALRKKVYVIDEVHMLTTEAFNALLKTLEEPPPHVTFVLATTEPHKLPNTILSRCQRYDFKLVPSSRLAQHLTSIFKAEKLAIDAGAISLLVRESGGSVRDALSLCDQIISYVGQATITEAHVAEVLGVADRSLTRTLVRSLSAGQAGAALSAVESAIERGVDEIQLARAIVRYLRDVAVLQVAPDRPDLVDASDEERQELAAEAREHDRSRITQMFDRMLRCCDELGKTLQPRLVLDCALIDVATLEPLIPMGDLIARLGELEGRLTRGGATRPSSGSTGSGGRPARVESSSRTAPPSPPSTRASAPQGTAGAGTPGVATAGAGTHTASTAGAGTPGVATAGAGTHIAGASATPTRIADADRSAVPEPPAGRPRPSDHSAPVSMQPSGPVPTVAEVASGSGPHAPTIGIPASQPEALRAWDVVLDHLEDKKRFSLAGPLRHARVLRWTADALDLGFPTDVHAMGEMASDAAKLDELRTVLRELGPDLKSIKVSVKLLDERESASAGNRSLIETSREKSTAERTKREAEAREHPITKHVLQTFGAQIKEIKTDV